MADNVGRYGFRWVRGHDGSKAMPMVEEHTVATAASFDVNAGAQTVNLRKGGPVRMATDGTVTLCDGAEGGGGALVPYGIVVGIKQYFDGSRLKVSPEFLPSDIAWGTVRERRSAVFVTPISAGVWEIDTYETNASWDTEAEFEAFIGENADYTLTGASGELYANPKIKISVHATTNTLMLRLVAISKTVENSDFTGNFVKLHVVANRAQRPWSSATGT